MTEAATIRGAVHSDLRHDSAAKHVSGRAEYIDDLPLPEGALHAYLGLSTVAHANITAMDLSEVEASPGVVGVLTGADVPGVNDVSPTHLHDEPILAEGKVEFWGQAIFPDPRRCAGGGVSLCHRAPEA